MRGQEWTREQKDTFLLRLAHTGNVSISARSVKGSRAAAYAIKGRDKEFAEDWDDAIKEAIDSLHESARVRAEEGVAEPVYYKGEVCGTVQKYSDSLLMSLLKAHDPRFKDQVNLNHATPGGVQLQHAAIDMSVYTEAERAQLQGLIHKQLQAKGGDDGE